MEGDGVAGGGTPMFAIFIISLLSLFLIPFTIYRLCNADGEAVKPWETAESKRKGALARNLNRLLTPSSLALIAAWVVLFGLLYYVQQFAKELAPFDPFDILKLDRGATEQDVKKAYKRLSLQYHPDKNSAPEAVPIYLQISQAYRALTDEEGRKNWEKFGHPDGKQAMDMGIAIPLPTGGQNGVVILALLVFVGLVLPMGVAAWFLFSSSKYMGPNQIMQETLDIFVRSKFAVKESQSLARIPDTLVYAMEYIMLPTPPEQQRPLDDLRKEILRSNPELKEKPQWFKRKPSIVKVHMLLLAHMARRPIPGPLQKDLEFVLRKAPLLLEEMVKIANIPRYAGVPYGWLTPTVGAVEMLQCLTQGVSIGSRKTFTHGKGGGDSLAPMLQLPHMTSDVLRKLSKKNVRCITDLMELGADRRKVELDAAGMDLDEIDEVDMALRSMPVVSIESAEFLVEGEEGSAPVLEEDVVTLAVHLVLRRASHREPEGAVSKRGSSVLAYAPHCPVPREEKWYVLLADPPQNLTLSWNSVSLKAAEDVGRSQTPAVKLGVTRVKPALEAPRAADGEKGSGKVAASGKEAAKGEEPSAVGEAASKAIVPKSRETSKPAEPVGQLVELRFRAPRQGKYDLTLYVISDSWIGCDKTLPMKLKVNELTRAEREGRTQRGKPLLEKAEQGAIENGEAAAEIEAGSEAEDSEEDEDYDSEEGSTEESGSDDEAVAEKVETDSNASSTEPPPLLREIEGNESP